MENPVSKRFPTVFFVLFGLFLVLLGLFVSVLFVSVLIVDRLNIGGVATWWTYTTDDPWFCDNCVSATTDVGGLVIGSVLFCAMAMLIPIIGLVLSRHYKRLAEAEGRSVAPPLAESL